MKNLSSIIDDKDIVTKEYVDNKVGTIPEEVVVSDTQPQGNDWKIWVDEDETAPEYYTKTETDTLLANKESRSNKVTSLSSSSTDTQYPSAKCVYDIIGNIETLLSEV